jgi:hypothetical protein
LNQRAFSAQPRGNYRRYLRRKLKFYAGYHDRKSATDDRIMATCEAAHYEGVTIPRSLRARWREQCEHDPFAPEFVRPRAWGR